VLAGLVLPLEAGAAEIPTITHGHRVDLEDHMVSGSYVLFDFYADWCGPCRAVESGVRALAEQHQNRLVVRKVDIVDWNSEVTRQFGLRSIPHLKLFGPGGELIAEGNAGLVLSALQRRLGAGPARAAPDRPSSKLVPVLAAGVIAAIVLFLLLGKRRRPGPIPETAGPAEPPAPDRPTRSTARDSNAVPIWFAVVQGSIDGPYSLQDLQSLRRSSQLGDQAQIRRKGDAEWKRLGDLLRDLPED